MLTGVRVVVADDDEVSLVMLTTILEELGVVCTACTNGKRALEALKAAPDTTDILLLDIEMPVMNGYEVLQHMKRDSRLADIPVIVLSANRDEKLSALKLGADDFLTKPYEIEELKLHFAKLVQWRRLTQSAKRAKNEFIAVVSHELRTPMNQILGLAELLNGETLTDGQSELLDLLRGAAEDMTGMIRDILNYSQMEHGAPQEMGAPFSLRTVVNSVLEAPQKEPSKNSRNMCLEIGDSITDTLNGYSFGVYKVLSILVDNAVKFTSNGSITISIREEPIGNSVSRFLCSVSDNGPGIPPGFHDRIFEPFVQLDSSRTRRHDGLGLGLALAKRLVEQMGGTIGVKSEVGRGSTFHFSFQCTTS